MVASVKDSGVDSCAFFSVPCCSPIETFNPLTICCVSIKRVVLKNNAREYVSLERSIPGQQFRMLRGEKMMFHWKLTTARWTPSPFRFCASRHCGSESTSSCLKEFTRVHVAQINSKIVAPVSMRPPRFKPRLNRSASFWFFRWEYELAPRWKISLAAVDTSHARRH